MENFDFNKCFNSKMTSEQALHVYVTLYKTVPMTEREKLKEAYHKADDIILIRDLENVKKGYMY